MERYCSFFDLDGTIVNFKSMQHFLEYCCNKRLIKKSLFNEINSLFNSSSKREFINAAYYKAYQGLCVDELQSLGEEWFSQTYVKQGKDLFIDSALKEIDFHKKNNAEIIIVSGSFMPCVLPIAKHLAINKMLLTNLEVKQGKYTGEIIGEPNIGAGKAKNILAYLRDHTHKLTNCYAYGDHESDLDMLKLVGFPCLVNASNFLKESTSKLNIRFI